MTPVSVLATSALVLSVTYVIGALRRQRRIDRAWAVVARVLGGRYVQSADAAPDRILLRIDGVDVEILGHTERDHAGRGVRPVTRVQARSLAVRDFRALLRVRARSRGGLRIEEASDPALVEAWLGPEVRGRLRDAAGYAFVLEDGLVIGERGALDDDPDRLVAVAGAVAALALGGRALATRWRRALEAAGADVTAAAVRDFGVAGLAVRVPHRQAIVHVQVAALHPGGLLATTVSVERLGGRATRFALARLAQIAGFSDVPAAPLPGLPGWWLRGVDAAERAAQVATRCRAALAREWPPGVQLCVVGPRAWMEWPGVEPEAATLRAAIELVAGFAEGGEDGPYR